MAKMGPTQLVTTGAWRLCLTTPWTVCRRLMQHEEFAMRRVRRFLGANTAYISEAGVEPALAGHGHGSRLLKCALASIALRWQGCVLRTEQPRNVRFYERNGFVLVDDFVVPVSGLQTWVFRWFPSQPPANPE